MLLAIDIGNTNIVLGLFQLPDYKLEADWRLETRAARTGDEYAALLSELFRLAGLDLSAVKAAIIEARKGVPLQIGKLVENRLH